MEIDPAWLETDFYATLEVSPDASRAEITKAYRRLARELHPDANPDPAAEDRFKEASVAYEVLRDTDTRAAYDQVRRPAGSGARRRPGGGYTIRVENLDGLGDVGRGADAQAELALPFAEAVAGTTRTVTAPGRDPATVRIPPGVDDGQTVRVPGRGCPGTGGAPAGDLLITVHVESHPVFGRDGRDLTVTVPVSYREAVLGADVTVPTLDGEAVTVRIPPGTRSGRVLRVRGRGVPSAAGAGDLLVTVQIDVPTSLDDRQRELIRELGRYDDPDRRAHLEVRP